MNEPLTVISDDIAAEAAEYISEKLNETIRRRNGCSLVLSGGSTPLDIYKRLASPILVGSATWERVHAFWGDERLVPPEDWGSNYRAAREALLSKVSIPAANIHRIKGELPAGEAIADYTEQLRVWAAENDPGAPNSWPRFDLVLLGLGEDGHTASLFPGSPVKADEPVIAVTADYGGRPTGRVTLTPPVFNDAARVIFLATGANKAEAVDNTFHVDDPVRYPAQRIRPASGEVVWFLDRAAAARLD